MKQILVLLLLAVSFTVYAQKAPDLSNIRLATESEAHDAESIALEAANYILASPFNRSNAEQMKSVSFIGMWMEKTPDYMYDIDKSTMQLFSENPELLAIYMAAITKFSIENKEASKDPFAMKVNGIITMLTYVENPNNKIVPGKPIKKLLEAKSKGELAKELME
jgi:hypothetical protein